MLGQFLPIFCALFLLAMTPSIVRSADPPAPSDNTAPSRPLQTKADNTPASFPSLAVLRNGEAISGRITQEKDRYVVESEGIEIRLPARDVDFLCRSLDEAYAIQHKRIAAGRVEDRLRLTNWCLRHGLLGYAAAELTTAMQTDPRHPGVAQLDRRLQHALARAVEPTEHTTQKPNASDANKIAVETPTIGPTEPISPLLPNPASSTAAIDVVATKRPPPTPASPAELDRLSRNLPGGTMEQFIETVQPLLINSCSTVGCHGPGSKSQYTLIRPPNGRIASRGLSQRNLFNTLQWLDHKRPGESDLLVKTKEPHGGKPVGVLVEDSIQYRQLAAWVRMATGSKPEPSPSAPASIDLNSPGTQAQVSAPFQSSAPVPYLNPHGASEPRRSIEKPSAETPLFEQPSSPE